MIPAVDVEPLVAALGDRACGVTVEGLSVAAQDLVARARAELHEMRGADVPPAFLAHVGRHVAAAGAPVLDAIGAIHAGDLLLAFFCAQGDERAIRTFRRRYDEDVLRASRRMRASAMDGDDLAQELARRAFSPPSPKILEYSGRGDLRAWVRVVATRLALDVARIKRSSERPTDATAFRGVADAKDAPERAYLKRLYHAEVRAALEAAARELSPDERTALREHYVLGMSIDDVAAAQGIHRATAARRVQRARQVLAEGVKRVLSERHGLEGRDLASVMNLVRSQMNITMERLLA